MPAVVALARESERVTLRLATISIAVALLLGWFAILLARRAGERIVLTLGRAGGASARHATYRSFCSGSSAFFSQLPQLLQSGSGGC